MGFNQKAKTALSEVENLIMFDVTFRRGALLFKYREERRVVTRPNKTVESEILTFKHCFRKTVSRLMYNS